MEKKRYKVVQLLEWFELGGGLESITGEIALGLDRDIFDVEIWCVARGGKLVDVFREKGVTVKVLDIESYFKPKNVLKLASLFKEARVDIIHAHVYFASTIGRVAGRIAGVKVLVHHVHSTYWHYTTVNLLIERVLSFWTHRIICVSEAVRRFVIEHEKIDPRRVCVIRNGISKQPVESREKMRGVLGFAAQDIVIVSVGSLLENKGHRILLDALRLLKARGIVLKCIIVGEGPTEGVLKDLTHSWGLEDCVRFLGVRRDVPHILSACDIFVLSSIEREGLPVSVLEAMAYGVPVIASNVGGVGEVITDGDNGALVAPADANMLADTIVSFALDPEKRKRTAARAAAVFEEKFESKVMLQAIENAYVECLRSQGVAI